MKADLLSCIKIGVRNAWDLEKVASEAADKEETAAAVADLADQENCTMLFVLIVDNKPKCHSSLSEIDLYIAGIASKKENHSNQLFRK